MDALHPDDRAMMAAVRRYLDAVNRTAPDDAPPLTPLGETVAAHLGADPRACAVVDAPIPDHRLVDLDLALEDISQATGGRLLGVTGGDQRLHSSLPELMSSPFSRFADGVPDYVVRDAGPGRTRRTVRFGLRLLRVDGVPLAVLQRAASPQYGRSTAVVEVLAEDPDAGLAFLDRVRSRMVELSVLRGQVLSFTPTEWGAEAGATFLTRPEVAAEDVILPPGVLDAVLQQVIGIGEHRDALRAAGRHLRRGVLLYGPPGTGKTLTVRHILSRSPGTTALVLTGPGIRYISAATEIARVFQPAIVVLEDIDLVAMERGATPQPLLFEVLDALDGIEGDADIAFVMTTNRVEVVEPALAERPGRVDLAVEIARPGLAERRRLFRRYADGVRVTPAAIEEASDRAEGTTGSFAKELMRRVVLRAASEGRDVVDDDLRSCLDAMLASSQALARRMLGGEPGAADPSATDDGDGDGDGGWTTYAPLSERTPGAAPLSQ